jgi:hypothetical protein
MRSGRHARSVRRRCCSRGVRGAGAQHHLRAAPASSSSVSAHGCVKGVSRVCVRVTLRYTTQQRTQPTHDNENHLIHDEQPLALQLDDSATRR